jgi:hypothetical protein
MKAALLARMHTRGAPSYMPMTNVIAFAYPGLTYASCILITFGAKSRTRSHTGKTKRQEQYFQVHEVLLAVVKSVSLSDSVTALV